MTSSSNKEPSMAQTDVKFKDWNKITKRIRQAELVADKEDLTILTTQEQLCDPATGRGTGYTRYGFMLVSSNERRIVLGGGEPGSLYSASLEQVETFLTTLGEIYKEGIADDCKEALKIAESAALALT
jgi:hypothetical protein